MDTLTCFGREPFLLFLKFSDSTPRAQIWGSVSLAHNPTTSSSEHDFTICAKQAGIKHLRTVGHIGWNESKIAIEKEMKFASSILTLHDFFAQISLLASL